MAVFLMSIVALGHLLNVAGNLALVAHQQSRAASLCQTKMNEVLGGAVALEGQGDVPFDEEPEYTWSLQADQGGVQGLYNVTVTVSRKQPNGDVVTSSLSQMVLDPQIVGSVYDTPTVTEDTTTGTQDANASTTTTSSSSSGGSSTPAAAAPASSAPKMPSSPARTSTPSTGSNTKTGPSSAPKTSPGGGSRGGAGSGSGR